MNGLTMRRTATIHPDAARVVEKIAELERDVKPPVLIAQMRLMMKERTRQLALDPPVVGRIVDQSIEGNGSAVWVRIYYPESKGAAPLPALIYCHGGGFVIGDLDMVETICRTICRESRIVVVSVQYRLAPEHPFPCGLEDTLAVISGIKRSGLGLGIDVTRLAVGGDSAGGNLAAVAAQEMGAFLRFQLLVYPVTDLTGSQPSYRDLGTGFPLTAEKMRWYVTQYLTDPAQAQARRASPLMAASLVGQPPALVVVAGLDPLVDEGLAYAARLREAGVKVEVVEIEYFPHGFLGWTRYCKAARDVLRLIANRLEMSLHGSG